MTLIYKKMNDVMREIGHIGKDGNNTSQKFRFRSIDQFMNVLYPLFTKHGIFMTTQVLDSAYEMKEVTRANGVAGMNKHVSIRMKYTFHAEDGSFVTSSVPAEGLDSGDKATNKALSAAWKYAVMQTFCVPTEETEEGDKDDPKDYEFIKTVEPKPVTSWEDRKIHLKNLSKNAGLGLQDLLAIMKNNFNKNSSAELSEDEYSKLCHLLAIDRRI